MTEATLEIGTVMKDGTIFAGLTADGKQQIYAMPKDLNRTVTFNDAEKAVEELNADKVLGHDDWQIPDLDSLHVLRKNQNEGKLKDTFKTVASRGVDSPDWYWSSMQDHDDPSVADTARFSDGLENWHGKNTSRVSCRPVRLVACKAP